MSIVKTDKKKNGLQGYRVRVGYTDLNGEYKQVERSAYGITEAKDLEQQLYRDMQNRELSVMSTMTVKDLYEDYVKAQTYSIRATSLDKSKRILNSHVLDTMSNVRLNKLTIPVLQRWKDSIGALDLKTTTKSNIFKGFSALLNYAVRLGYMPKNPLPQIGNFKEVYFEKPQDTLHYYTPDEYKAYSAAARACAEQSNSTDEWNYYVFFSVAFYMGLRKGENNALKWSDIDGDIMHVRRSVAQKLKGESIVETPPKNKSSYRDLKIPLPLMTILKEQKQRQQTNNKRFTDDLRICGGEACLRDSSIENHNKKYAEAAKLPHIRIHDFRHTHATVLVNEGINIQEIARRLGHSKVEITWNTYAHLYPREEERAVSVLNEIRT